MIVLQSYKEKEKEKEVKGICFSLRKELRGGKISRLGEQYLIEDRRKGKIRGN